MSQTIGMNIFYSKTASCCSLLRAPIAGVNCKIADAYTDYSSLAKMQRLGEKICQFFSFSFSFRMHGEQMEKNAAKSYAECVFMLTEYWSPIIQSSVCVCASESSVCAAHRVKCKLTDGDWCNAIIVKIHQFSGRKISQPRLADVLFYSHIKFSSGLSNLMYI